VVFREVRLSFGVSVFERGREPWIDAQGIEGVRIGLDDLPQHSGVPAALHEQIEPDVVLRTLRRQFYARQHDQSLDHSHAGIARVAQEVFAIDDIVEAVTDEQIRPVQIEIGEHVRHDPRARTETFLDLDPLFFESGFGQTPGVERMERLERVG
jgi:hypothetical protein